MYRSVLDPLLYSHTMIHVQAVLHLQMTFLTLSQTTKEFADDNFNFDENSRKFFYGVENTVGKGEIARYKQFLLFPQCFQKTCTADT